MTAIAIMLGGGGVAEAKTTFKPKVPYNNFYFHANCSELQFDPAAAFGLKVYNCADGTMPTPSSDGVHKGVFCLHDTNVPAQLLLQVDVPAGTCVQKGTTSCSFRDHTVPKNQGVPNPGLRLFRVSYPTAAFPRNKFWLDFYGGDFSVLNQANMVISTTFNGSQGGCDLFDTFTPLRNGGWWSKY